VLVHSSLVEMVVSISAWGLMRMLLVGRQQEQRVETVRQSVHLCQEMAELVGLLATI
jgi:hypothetical protein